MYYKLLTMKQILIDRSSGSTFLEISKKGISDLEITVPSIDEQRAIASALSDLDAEIEALKRRREKARQIKQGMMQQLLTGRVRLVKPGAVGAA
ncbi:MAG: restriction endonuclease subunit S [Desulfobacterales bacterium]